MKARSPATVPIRRVPVGLGPWRRPAPRLRGGSGWSLARALAWALASGWLLASPLSAQAHAVTDEAGNTVDFAQPPRRIVSMVPSLTESLCELGECARLVGVDRYSNWPATVGPLPHLGGLDDADVEGITALRPDVVLVSSTSRITLRLRSLGFKVLVLEPRSHEDVRRVLGILGAMLSIPPDAGAERLWRDIDRGISEAAATLPAWTSPPRVYFEVSEAPYAAGEASFIGQTLKRLGAQNVVPADLGPFPKLNPEFIVRANPDVILIAERGFDSLGRRPGWATIGALRAGHVCRFRPEQGDVLVRAGPRIAEAARMMADCLRRFSR